jgi:cellulose synthase/poly-beta-1,6-N-acetylglucosamine synthase-like glycosyltransferase
MDHAHHDRAKGGIIVQATNEIRTSTKLPWTSKGNGHGHDLEELEVSIVMPCLNESESIGVCVDKAWEALKKYGYKGEVVVSDNGSTDGSPEMPSMALASFSRRSKATVTRI